MSILEGTLINLHEYEHDLIRALLTGGTMWPPSTTPGFEESSTDAGEAAIIELNHRNAEDLYIRYKKRSESK